LPSRRRWLTMHAHSSPPLPSENSCSTTRATPSCESPGSPHSPLPALGCCARPAGTHSTAFAAGRTPGALSRALPARSPARHAPRLRHTPLRLPCVPVRPCTHPRPRPSVPCPWTRPCPPVRSAPRPAHRLPRRCSPRAGRPRPRVAPCAAARAGVLGAIRACEPSRRAGAGRRCAAGRAARDWRCRRGKARRGAHRAGARKDTGRGLAGGSPAGSFSRWRFAAAFAASRSTLRPACAVSACCPRSRSIPPPFILRSLWPGAARGRAQRFRSGGGKARREAAPASVKRSWGVAGRGCWNHELALCRSSWCGL